MSFIITLGIFLISYKIFLEDVPEDAPLIIFIGIGVVLATVASLLFLVM